MGVALQNKIETRCNDGSIYTRSGTNLGVGVYSIRINKRIIYCTTSVVLVFFVWTDGSSVSAYLYTDELSDELSFFFQGRFRRMIRL